MNLGGHIVVAAHVAPHRPAFWLGSALPDVATIGGFRLLGTTHDAELTAGIAFHHVTDDVFHSHPFFVDVQRRLRGALADAGINRGAARAIAHVGPELLIDGQLLAGPSRQADVHAAFDQIPILTEALRPLVNGDDDRVEAWVGHARQFTGRSGPLDHDDPDAVAERLWRILRRRPRLAFEREQMAVVADTLRAEHVAIKSNAEPLLDDLVRDAQSTSAP